MTKPDEEIIEENIEKWIQYGLDIGQAKKVIEIIKELSLRKKKQQDELLNIPKKPTGFSAPLIAEFEEKVDELEKVYPLDEHRRFNEGLEKAKKIMRSVFTK